MRKLIFASISALALLTLAACEGSQTPQSGGGDQTGSTTAPAPSGDMSDTSGSAGTTGTNQ